VDVLVLEAHPQRPLRSQPRLVVVVVDVQRRDVVGRMTAAAGSIHSATTIDAAGEAIARPASGAAKRQSGTPRGA
jgi:hypothetical protein